MILKFKSFEKYINIHDKPTMVKYVDIVYDMLKKSYEYAGGLKGTGFKTPTDMISSMKLIKIYKYNDEFLCCVCYKDKEGRKVVALGTNGSLRAKKELKKMLKFEFERSYMEVSDSMLKFIQKCYPDLFEKYKIKNNTDLKIFKDIIPIDDFYYKRKINNEYITKIALGTPHIKFY